MICMHVGRRDIVIKFSPEVQTEFELCLIVVVVDLGSPVFSKQQLVKCEIVQSILIYVIVICGFCSLVGLIEAGFLIFAEALTVDRIAGYLCTVDIDFIVYLRIYTAFND